MIRLLKLTAIVVGLAVVAGPATAQSSDPASAPPDSSSASAPAQAEAQPVDWQSVIDKQVQAFRDHDAEGALAEAAAVFHTMFPDAKDFFATIMSGGYAPIMDSQSDSFGDYVMVDPDTVLQRVKFLGKDQNLYDAIYQMGREDAGWRVQAVQLVKTPGMGV